MGSLSASVFDGIVYVTVFPYTTVQAAKGTDDNVGGVLAATTILKGKFYTGLIPSLNDAVTVNVPESDIVGLIVYVQPDNVTNEG